MLYVRSMFTNKNNANDHSRNGRSAAKSPKREKEGSNLIKAVQETAGERNHVHGYSLDILANFFRKTYDFAKFVNPTTENERFQVNELFERIKDCLDFNVYLQRKVATHLKGKFTSAQLSCIFQAYNGIWIQYDNNLETFVKKELYDFIDLEGKAMYDIGNADAFKAIIESMNLFEFEIFVNLILEVWGIEGDMIARMHDFLLGDSQQVI
jgi:hypothetical protein